jgi:hypothetical protein
MADLYMADLYMVEMNQGLTLFLYGARPLRVWGQGLIAAASFCR